ncbi:MAG: DUF2532 domain-containing protein [Syntrophaceae bacterium]|nr:DUF2532 domain-containing protein [Syntrophaceae bacterium]
MDKSNEKLVVVLGMHRSGTSMMSGLLTMLGLFPGGEDRLLKKDENNQKGYFEDRIIVECNEKILSDAVNAEFPEIHDSECFLDKGTLDGFGWLYGAWLNETLVQSCTPTESKLLEETIKIYKSQLLPHQICLIKDPRMSLTIGKWSEKIKINAAIVIVRNPVDVALSLYKRDKITTYIAYNIWKLYNLKAMIAIENIPHMIVDYNSFTENKKKSLSDILSFLEKKVNLNTNDTVISPVLAFVEKTLNHGNSKSDSGITADLLEFYNEVKNGNLKNIKNQYEDFYEKIKYGWREAMYVAAKHQSNYMKTNYKNIIDRINNHIISGFVVKLIRIIKGDPTFGTYKDI